MFQIKTTLVIVGAALLALTTVSAIAYSKGKSAERSVWEGKVNKAKTQRIKEYEEDLTRYEEQVSRDATHSTQLSRQLLELRAERDRLAAQRIPLVRIKEVPVNVQGKCTISVLTGAFGVCFAAAATGEPTPTAACQAAGSDAGTVGSTSF